MRYISVAVVAAAAVGWTVCSAEPPAVRGFTIPAPASVPYTYCVWYLRDPDSASFLEALKASPPDLFHLGYHIPFKGALGPTYGHELFSDAILPPAEIPREVERIQGILRAMRAAGVDRIIPYVYTMAFFGNPDQRTGFFHFFDHWDDYRSFGLGPKPAVDPALWSQVPGPRPLGGGPPGVLHYDPCINHPAWSEYLDLVVRQLAGVGYDGMFFDVNTLYCYCPHCEDQFDVYLLEKYARQGLRKTFGTDDHRILNLSTIYRDFEATILDAFKAHLAGIWGPENLADVLGAPDPDAVKLEEDWRLLRCYMQGSRGEFPPAEDFPKHLLERFGSERKREVPSDKQEAFVQTVLRRHFRTFLDSPGLAALLEKRFGSSDIRRRCCSKPRDLLLWVETQRFWCDSMAALFARLKNMGRATLAARGSAERPGDGSKGDFYTVANLGSMATVDGLNKRRVDGIDLVRWARAADMQMFEEMQQPGTLESGVILSNVLAFRWAMGAGTRAGTLLYKATTDRAADLAEAEAAAGGGGAFIQGGVSAPDSRRRWKRFFAEHADLWDRGSSWAQVGLLFWSDQVFYEYPEHLAMVYRLVRVLSESQIPFDIVTEEGLGTVGRYDAVIAPGLRYLDAPQIEALLAYAGRGGNLVIIEPFGAEDKRANPRAADCLAAENWVDRGAPCARHGRGSIVRLNADDVPARESDFWCLMEERANAFTLARDFLDAARRKDLERGVDLGPRFLDRIEGALKICLRWCPIETDPAVYIHAYHLAPSPEHPERIVVHAVNYHVPILLEKGGERRDDPTWSPVTVAGEPVSSRDLRIRVPLPRNARVKRVEALSPVDTAGPVKWSATRSHVNLTVDQLTLYQALVIELDAAPG